MVRAPPDAAPPLAFPLYGSKSGCDSSSPCPARRWAEGGKPGSPAPSDSLYFGGCLSVDAYIHTGTFGASGLTDRKIACGDFAGKLCMYDLERLNSPPVYEVQAHASIINQVDGAGGQVRMEPPLDIQQQRRRQQP